MKKMKRKIPWTILVFIILFVNARYWCDKKEGYYIDELWSYGLSNSYYSPFLHQKENYINEWHQPSFYEDYLTVKQEEAFSYGSVYGNQTQDVHPPCFYMLLHTLCSLFPGRFSKWFGLSVNIVFYFASICLLYQISGLLLGRENHSNLIPPLLYGLSMGAVSTLIYIRMYMLLTFWTLLFVYLSFRLIKAAAYPKRFFLHIGIGLTTMAGFLTQYYFLIFAFFFSVGYVVWHMFIRQWRRTIEYSAAVLAGIIGGILLFPFSLHHIFLGHQGKQAFVNISNDISFFLNRWRLYQDTVISEFLGSGHIVPALLLSGFFLLSAASIVSARKKKCKLCLWDTVPKVECLILLITVSGYFTVVVQISPEITGRYQFPIYPYCVLLGTSLTVYLLKQAGCTQAIWIVTAGCLFFILRAYTVQPVPYVYEGYQEVLDKLATEYKDTPGIYITAGDHLLINNCLFLAQQNRTYSLTPKQMAELPQICNGMDAGQLILYVDIYYDEMETAGQTAKLLGYRSYSLLYDNTFTQIFLLSNRHS